MGRQPAATGKGGGGKSGGGGGKGAKPSGKSDTKGSSKPDKKPK